MLTTPHCKNLPCYGTFNKDDDVQDVISKKNLHTGLTAQQLNTETNDRYPHISVFFFFPVFDLCFPIFPCVLYFIIFSVVTVFFLLVTISVSLLYFFSYKSDRKLGEK